MFTFGMAPTFPAPVKRQSGKDYRNKVMRVEWMAKRKNTLRVVFIFVPLKALQDKP